MTEPLDTSFPLKEFLGFEIERGKGRAVASLELGEHHMNPNDIANAVACELRRHGLVSQPTS